MGPEFKKQQQQHNKQTNISILYIFFLFNTENTNILQLFITSCIYFIKFCFSELYLNIAYLLVSQGLDTTQVGKSTDIIL